jgi:hypothetical protein
LLSVLDFAPTFVHLTSADAASWLMPGVPTACIANWLSVAHLVIMTSNDIIFRVLAGAQIQGTKNRFGTVERLCADNHPLNIHPGR